MWSWKSWFFRQCDAPVGSQPAHLGRFSLFLHSHRWLFMIQACINSHNEPLVSCFLHATVKVESSFRRCVTCWLSQYRLRQNLLIVTQRCAAVKYHTLWRKFIALQEALSFTKYLNWNVHLIDHFLRLLTFWILELLLASVV